jgi:hypothetical protein
MKWTEKEESIRSLERGGKVDPLDLIAAARSPEHPCHDDFTWDVEAAAQERWRDQARSLIRRCKFDVLVEDVTESVVHYIPSPDDEPFFVSVPKLRGKAKTKAGMLTELNMLLGLVARIRGLALAKQNIIGSNVSAQLCIVLDMVKALKSEMEE